MSSTIQTKARIATLTYIHHVAALRQNASFVPDPYIDKKRQKAALHQSNDRWLRHWCTSFVPAPDIDKKTARSLHRPKAMIVTLNYIHHVTALTWNTSFVPDPYIDKKRQKAALHQSNDRWLRRWCTSFVPAPYIDKKQQKAALHQNNDPYIDQNIFTSKCAKSHSGVQWFNIGTSKSAPKTTVFSHFHFQMCEKPQRRTMIQHRNVQKCSEDYSFLTFSLPNARKATAAYNYSTSERPKVLRRLQFFNIFTSKCAFRHSGVQFLMSPLSTYLRTRRFNRPTFGLTRHTNLWKNTAFRVFSNI